jgi:hypothetical protein
MASTMPTRADQPEDVTRPETRIARKISQARLALGFERLWSALHWPMLIMWARPPCW